MPMKHDLSHMYALKSAIEDLLGEAAWRDLKECTSLATWRRYVLKVIDAIELSVKTNIQICDEDWMNQVTNNLAHGRDLARIARNTDDLVAALTATLLEQVFLQLGHAPHRKTSRAVTLKAENWRLDGFRTVQIVQTPAQREALFMSKQRREIGFDAQFDLEAEYRRSRSKIPYSVWCAQRESEQKEVSRNGPENVA
ncbi:hypothetical protein DEH84_17640 (plasmid) [Aquabacterium olei]|uniref:Uncharacterized protein n=1 Tax=Aquabacterium olei TaxID=1296669 RepID=A0A2U8FYW8_9BURK|nr:hypothetical protein [Aquabacterium olei]AWI55416.1 hypothetical protein DEH84_17640 [Aquabacterium olei]